MKKLICLSAFLSIFATSDLLKASFTGVLAQSVPVDLNTWNQEGDLSDGNWNVSGDGNSVFQSINGDPTFFVSPEEFINTTFNGAFEVQTTGDDDYIGFVFGYQSPLASNSDPVNDYNFFLFDWKQNNQSSGGQLAEEGFSLVQVNGVINDFLPGFWGHNDSPEFNVLDTDYGSTRGWADNTEYDFTLLYQTDRIKIEIEGGIGDFATKQTIFDLTPADVGLTEFQPGKFGFYNYSQPNVFYQGFTQADTPTDPVTPDVPEPSFLLSLLTLSSLSLVSKYKKKF